MLTKTEFKEAMIAIKVLEQIIAKVQAERNRMYDAVQVLKQLRDKQKT